MTRRVINLEEKSREVLLEMLKKGECSVVFIKKDGDVRIMKCTLNEQFLPPIEEEVSSKKTRSYSEESIRVWSTEDKGWRSFRVDSVINMERVPKKRSRA